MDMHKRTVHVVVAKRLFGWMVMDVSFPSRGCFPAVPVGKIATRVVLALNVTQWEWLCALFGATTGIRCTSRLMHKQFPWKRLFEFHKVLHENRFELTCQIRFSPRIGLLHMKSVFPWTVSKDPLAEPHAKRARKLALGKQLSTSWILAPTHS